MRRKKPRQAVMAANLNNLFLRIATSFKECYADMDGKNRQVIILYIILIQGVKVNLSH